MLPSEKKIVVVLVGIVADTVSGPVIDTVEVWSRCRYGVSKLEYGVLPFLDAAYWSCVLRGLLVIRAKIMPPRMRTRSAGRPVAESRGGRTDERVGRGGRGRGPRGGNDDRVDKLNGQGNDQGANLLPAILAQVGNQGNVGSQNGNVVNENIQENVRNVLVNSNWVGCSYKGFLACNPKEYDGKGGAIVLTRWIEKMESVQDMSGCSVDQKVKYTAGSFVGKALTWWDSQIPTLSRKVQLSDNYRGDIIITL
ncbi:hypothetical protein Tco_0642576 [Tanacetum coccineum]